MSPEDSSAQPAAMDEAAVIILIAAGYSLILGLPGWLGRPDVSWQRFLFTNCWMLAAVLLWSRWHPLRPISWKRVSAGNSFLLPTFFLASLALLGTTISPGGQMARGAITAFDYIALTTLVPAAEECFYRGLLFNFLLRRLSSTGIAMIIVSVVFVIGHFPGPKECVTLALISMVLCTMALRSRSLVWPWLLHSGWNLCVLGWSGPRDPSRHLVVSLVAAGILAGTWMMQRTGRPAGAREADLA